MNQQFTDETCACMIISEDAYAMLLTHRKFAEFTPNPFCDARKSTEVLLALERRAKVDDQVRPPRRTLAPTRRGGKTCSAARNHDFMYQHGHLWELFWVNPTTIPM
jgi:hypothetical protein